MHEANDAYIGYADKEELTIFLNELLAELLRTVQRDEAHWCAMLVRHVKALGEKPSAETGAFYGKAMGVAELRERVALLNRGQGWVVRKLRENLPRVRDNQLHADLSDMLRSHEINIDRLNGCIYA